MCLECLYQCCGLVPPSWLRDLEPGGFSLVCRWPGAVATDLTTRHLVGCRPCWGRWRFVLLDRPCSRWLWPSFASRRIGEASNPGPDVTDQVYRILSANVTAANSSWPLIVNLAWDVALLQESRLGLDSQVYADIRRRGWRVLAGQLAADGSSLVMMVFRFGAVTALQLGSDPRLQGALWSPGGRSHFRLYNLYGVADGSEAARVHVSGLARQCLVDSESAGCMPSVICGDFNFELVDLDVLPSFIIKNWGDCSEAATCAAASAHTARRIDLLIANSPFQRRLRNVEVDWETGLFTHAAQFLCVAASCPAPCRTWVPAAPIPTPGGDAPTPARCWTECAALVKAYEEIARRAPGDVDSLWCALENIASKYHSLRTMAPLGLVGRTGIVKVQRLEPRSRTGEASQVLLDRCGRRVRRLTELARRWPVGPAAITQHARDMRRVLADAESWRSPWRAEFLSLHTSAGVARLLDLAEAEFNKQLEATRQDRRDRWQSWCSESLREHNGKLWRWIKEGPRPVICLSVTPPTHPELSCV